MRKEAEDKVSQCGYRIDIQRQWSAGKVPIFRSENTSDYMGPILDRKTVGIAFAFPRMRLCLALSVVGRLEYEKGEKR